MGNGLLKEQQWRIFKRQVSYKQFLRDVHYANAICAHSFADPRTGARLRFDPVTNVDHHELLPVLWRLEGKLLVIARAELPPPPSQSADEMKEEKAPAPAPPATSGVGHALTVQQFYHLFIYLTDNLPLLQHARTQLHRLTLPPLPPSSLSSPSSAAPSTTQTAPTADEDDTRVCSICMSSAVDLALPCLHAFCRECIEDWHERDATCPLCRVKANASTDDVWVMNGNNEADLEEQINTVCRFPFVYLDDKPEYVA